jgi:L-fuculose-phosphate aldolase
MLMEEERNQIVQYGKKMIKSALTTATGGNLSIYNDKEGLMAISPTGLDYFLIEAKDIVIMDLDGNIMDGNRKPSSEYQMHSIFYNKRRDVRAVVHTHSVYATSISTLNWEIPSMHYLVAVAGEKVPCAKYATYGTSELAENAYRAMGDKYMVTLLANHGLLALGSDIDSAYERAEIIEFMAEVFYRAKSLGEPVILEEEEIERVREKLKNYGQ